MPTTEMCIRDRNTELRGEILLCPGVFGTDSFFCRLPDGDEVTLSLFVIWSLQIIYF